MIPARDKPQNWYAITDCGDGIWRISEPWLRPLHGANCWLIRGGHTDLLFDSGCGVAPLAPYLPRSPLCVLSHGHYDHIGGAHEFTQRLVHPLIAPVLAQPTPDNTLAAGWFGPHSVRPNAPCDLRQWQLRPAPLTGSLHDDQIIDLGDRQLRVLFLPGHDPGLIGLIDSLSGALFSADAAYQGRMFLDLPASNRIAARTSFARMLALEPRIIHPSHGDSFDRTTLARIAEQNG